MDLVDGLPPSVTEIVEYLARWARGYNNKLKFNEVSKFKADLVNMPERWKQVDVDAFGMRCKREGMRDEDIATLIVLLIKAQNGRRLIPGHGYNPFTFGFPVDS